MDAGKLYKKLDMDFDIEHFRDGWEKMDFNDFISNTFKQRRLGLVLDNSEEIIKVYTAVFPSEGVIKKLLASGEKNVLLFTHHPMIWDPTLNSFPFRNIDKKLLRRLRNNKISLYTLHVPLDKNGDYSTAVNLAKALGITKKGEFCEYYGVKVGIYGKTKYRKVTDLANKIKESVGHRIKLWNYGEPEIKNNTVALVAGGGNAPDIIKDVVKLGINTYVTGVTLINRQYHPSVEFHNIAKENEISVIGATHYSTEKFACIAIVDYFRRLGFPCEFIEDKNPINDLI
ncbi:MAG: Nif3-like dinuclear metal center hexameric protein [Candidatus Aenigmarchaeota archaeon]|nr:Nif3-like dinuclear metal center hexameric protein [Candidatus Aenigmarchaeota archaeon]